MSRIDDGLWAESIMYLPKWEHQGHSGAELFFNFKAWKDAGIIQGTLTAIYRTHERS